MRLRSARPKVRILPGALTAARSSDHEQRQQGADLGSADHLKLVDERLQERFALGRVTVLDHLVDVCLEGPQVLVGERLGSLLVLGGLIGHAADVVFSGDEAGEPLEDCLLEFFGGKTGVRRRPDESARTAGKSRPRSPS